MADILVVDDDSGMREWLTEVLKCAGHRVFAAHDGLEARSIAKTETLDVVITDVSMPNEEGLGLILALKRSHPGLKTVVLSGKDPEALQDAVLLGAYAAFRKPVTAKAILACIGSLSQQEAKSHQEAS
jgi:DNA-binding NtrC family response regulator